MGWRCKRCEGSSQWEGYLGMYGWFTSLYSKNLTHYKAAITQWKKIKWNALGWALRAGCAFPERALQAQAPVLTTLSSALPFRLSYKSMPDSSHSLTVLFSLITIPGRSQFPKQRDAPTSFWISLCLLQASETIFSLHFWLKYLICIKTLANLTGCELNKYLW